MILATAGLVTALTMVRSSTPPALASEAGWSGAAETSLTWDFTNNRPVSQRTSVRVLFDDRYLYVRFEARQREPVVATQAVDDVGQGSDDVVRVILWPSGPGGFQYTFEANPRGTHYQSSTENTSFAPTWASVGALQGDGYRVTMRIPLNALRGDGRSTWNVQFTRTIRQAAEVDEWMHASGQTAIDAVAYAGLVPGFKGAAEAAQTRSRIGVYALADARSSAVGGATSRMGMDLAVPLTRTSSFVAAIHPDYSNVEIDQQTIAPTTFRRQYTEVRPFFAQGANFYDATQCFGCPAALELYTPAIPTPRRGYQLEGKQGAFTFGALDAVGDGRIDDAQSLAYTTPNRTIQADYTRVASEQRFGAHDVVDFGHVAWNDQKRWSAYAEGGIERGSAVVDVRQAQRYNAGIAYDPKDTLVSLSLERVGPQYSPADGFVAVSDIAGYTAQASRTWRYVHGSLQSTNAAVFIDRFNGSDGLGTNLFDANASAYAFFRSGISVLGSIGSSFYRVAGDRALHPHNQQLLRVDYKLGSSVQSTLSWNAGRFGDGYLTSPTLQAGFRIKRAATVALYAVDTDWRGDAGKHFVQWLERASVTFDLGPRASLVAGARKIVGTPPLFNGLPPAPFANVMNLAFGFATRRPHSDVYLVYGDASAFQTRPALTLKVVRYLGAEKGT